MVRWFKKSFLVKFVLIFIFKVVSLCVFAQTARADAVSKLDFKKDMSVKLSFLNKGSELAKLLRKRRDTTSFVSTVGEGSKEQINSGWRRALSKISNLHLVRAPSGRDKVRAIKTHLNEQVKFYNYSENKPAVIMLSILTTNSALNWIIFGGTTPEAAKATIIMINAVLYAYIGVNVPNWRRLLNFSKTQLKRIKSLDKAPESLKSFISSAAANFSYYMGYNYLIQGVLNFNQIDRILGVDVFALALANSAFGVFSSGFWDPVFESWLKKGKITEKQLDYVYYGRSIVMGVLSNLAAIGFTDVRMLMIGSGATASVIMLSDPKIREAIKIKLGPKIKALIPRLPVMRRGKMCADVLR